MKTYLELIRFSHTLFALPFALLSAAMAVYTNSRGPDIREIIGFFACMIFARSAAMAFNRFADRKIDALNPRTEKRHIPAGKISSGTVLSFTFACSVLFVLATLLFLPNRIPIFCSVPVLIWLFGYSYAKRFTISAHFWLGTSLMLPPIAAWLALRPEIQLGPIILGLAVLFWSAGFDILYATQDADFDAKMRLFSIPGRLGIRNSMRIAAASHALTILLLGLLPIVFPPLFPYFYVGVILAGIVLGIEHWIVRPKKENETIDLERINVAFFHLNVVISNGLLLIGIVSLLISSITNSLHG